VSVVLFGCVHSNVLPLQYELEADFFSESSMSALRAVFSSWNLEACKEWLESPEGVGLQLGLEEETNKYFPLSNSSREVRDSLLQACEKSGVTIKYGMSMEDIRQGPGSTWECVCPQGTVACRRLIISTGGLSFPKVGTDGTGHKVVQKLGHTLGNGIYPALTPLVGAHPGGSNLAGVSMYSVKCSVKQPGKKKKKKKVAAEALRSGFLFTHKGYSGPSVLDLSHHAVKAIERGADLPVFQVSWNGEDATTWETRLRSGGSSPVVGMLKKHFPQRLAEAFCHEAGVPMEKRLAELRKEDYQQLVKTIAQYEVPYSGHQGYAKAEVTGGGIPLTELNCSTLESKILPGVYFCGEICDVFGRIGGFNFYWAWLSGRLAGISAGTF